MDRWRGKEFQQEPVEKDRNETRWKKKFSWKPAGIFFEFCLKKKKKKKSGDD